MEDLDPVTSSRAHAASQLADLHALGLDWDGPVVFQSERFHRYDAAIDHLRSEGLVYECYCTRREIAEASAAPNGPLPDGAYPGTCRTLTDTERAVRRNEGRRFALRLRTNGEIVGFHDEIHGPYEAAVDDVVLRRNDGMPAYNLAVVVDDAAQGISQVVRADDLLSSTPRQIQLGRLLGYSQLRYAHIPLVVNRDGARLAKRDGAVTLADLSDLGVEPSRLLSLLGESLGLNASGEHVTPSVLLSSFSPASMPTAPWVFDPATALQH
jgi:glutamyl-tRNA synthetase